MNVDPEFDWYWLGDEHGVLQLNSRFATPRFGSELHVDRSDGTLVAWWTDADGESVRVVAPGEA